MHKINISTNHRARFIKNRCFFFLFFPFKNIFYMLITFFLIKINSSLLTSKIPFFLAIDPPSRFQKVIWFLPQLMMLFFSVGWNSTASTGSVELCKKKKMGQGRSKKRQGGCGFVLLVFFLKYGLLRHCMLQNPGIPICIENNY